MNFLKMFLNLKLKGFIKGAIAQIEKKHGKLMSYSISLENPNMKR